MSTLMKRFPALALAAAVAWTTGCGIETQVTGITADSDIASPNLMPALAHGSNMELTHIHFIDYLHFTAAATDEVTNGYSNSSSYRRRAVNQYQNRPDYVYSQAHEAGWSAAYAAERMQDVNVEFGTDPDTDPLIAHMRVNSALAMEFLAEGQCVACIAWGPEGGNLLRESGDVYDASNVIDSDSIMKMAITWAEMAIPIAEGAIAAGRVNEYEADFYHFIPENSLAAANGVIARAYLWLGDYAKADQYAAKVPLDFSWNMVSHEENSWRNRWIYYTTRYGIVTTFQSAIGTTFADVDDPRIPWTKCGDFKEGFNWTGGRSGSSSWFDQTTYKDNPDCYLYYSTYYRYRTQDGDLPNWVPLKFTSENDDLPIITGTEMKLIRAEVALRNGQLGAFAGFVNEVRAMYGLDPIATPATAGALEYPNAEDDGWSILDREKLFTNWLEGRRYADFRRWEHPFWTGGFYKTPDELNDNAGQPRPKYMRADKSLDWCMPLPDGEECNVNPGVRTTEWCATLYAPGEGG